MINCYQKGHQTKKCHRYSSYWIQLMILIRFVLNCWDLSNLKSLLPSKVWESGCLWAVTGWSLRHKVQIILVDAFIIKTIADETYWWIYRHSLCWRGSLNGFSLQFVHFSHELFAHLVKLFLVQDFWLDSNSYIFYIHWFQHVSITGIKFNIPIICLAKNWKIIFWNKTLKRKLTSCSIVRK